MKWMIRKRLESDWMDERDRELKAGDCQLSWGSPCVYLPFLKGTSVDERELEYTWESETSCILEWIRICSECR